jgi:ABC-type phosphate/phosphonate transport system ATPase subunit
MDKIVIENLSLQYADGTESLRGISMRVPENSITVMFGPAGGGKSTLLRCINRLNDLTEVKASSGANLIDGDVLDQIDVMRCGFGEHSVCPSGGAAVDHPAEHDLQPVAGRREAQIEIG